jgi:predicted PhzF superfamily epimerase YddE/YHI9
MTNIHLLRVFTDANGNFGDLASVVIDKCQKISDSKRQELTKQLDTGETAFVNDVVTANVNIIGGRVATERSETHTP